MITKMYFFEKQVVTTSLRTFAHEQEVLHCNSYDSVNKQKQLIATRGKHLTQVNTRAFRFYQLVHRQHQSIHSDQLIHRQTPGHAECTI